jgi:hypothetical protein
MVDAWLKLANHLVEAANYDAAAREGDGLAKEPKLTGELMARLAEVYVACAQDASEHKKDDQANALAAKAVALLNQAEADGMFRRHPEAIKRLATLAGRPLFERRADFQALRKKVNDKK